MNYNAKLMRKVYIGTSGFAYEHWRGVFYPQDLRQKDWLGYYAKYFDTLEINASFYHQMGRKVYEGWPTSEVITADFTYLRFHGHDSLYGSCYNCNQLHKPSESESAV